MKPDTSKSVQRTFVARCLRYFCFYLVLISCAAPSLDSQTPDAKTELNLGITAYEQGAYQQAIRHLEHAVSLDPKATVGHFYLALAYNNMCLFPNAGDPHWSGLAIQEYRKVLELDPSHKDALKSMAYLFFELAQREEAERYYRKAVELDANDPEALYGIAVIEWRQTFQVLEQKRDSLKLARKRPLIGLPACEEIRSRNLTRVEEGISLLRRTLQLLDDAEPQTYMAAFYQERAELQCGDNSAYERDLKSSKQWWKRSCETRHNQKERVILPRWIPGLPPPPPKRGDTCDY